MGVFMNSQKRKRISSILTEKEFLLSIIELFDRLHCECKLLEWIFKNLQLLEKISGVDPLDFVSGLKLELVKAETVKVPQLGFLNIGRCSNVGMIGKRQRSVSSDQLLVLMYKLDGSTHKIYFCWL